MGVKLHIILFVGNWIDFKTLVTHDTITPINIWAIIKKLMQPLLGIYSFG